MKVGCQQCGASYSVADEKVAGRRLKLRCKKCGEPMVIDGSAPGSEDDSFGAKLQVVNAPASPIASDTEWYVASDDAAQGPYTLREVQSHYAAALITADTLVFREGLDGWTAAAAVPELHAQLDYRGSLPPPPPPSVHASRASVVPGAFDRSPSMGRDPFADVAPAPSPRVSASQMLAEGSQREGTVQFSLDDIRALSAVSAPSSIAPPAPVRTGYASGDGSGLIDVRSLSEGAASDAFQPVDDIPASPLDTMAPLALPARARHGGVDFRTKVLAGLASFGFLLAGAIGVFAITRAPQPQAVVTPVPSESRSPLPQPSATRAPQPAAQGAAVVAQPADDGKPVAEEPTIDGADRAPERAVAADKGRRRAAARRAPVRSDAPVERASAKPERSSDIDDLLVAKAPVKEKEKEEKSSSASKGGDDLDSLLLGALDGKKAAAKSEPEPAAPSALPKTPSRDQMLAALGKAKTKAGKCKGPGVATAAITIAGSGRVSSVAVSGVEGGAKSCVENAVRSTPFPKFQQENFAVKFPFKLGS
jgi:predicted Zn finger-like uncharacterized protein